MGWLTVSIAKKCLFVADSQGLKQRRRKYLHRKDWPRDISSCFVDGIDYTLLDAWRLLVRGLAAALVVITIIPPEPGRCLDCQ